MPCSQKHSMLALLSNKGWNTLHQGSKHVNRKWNVYLVRWTDYCRCLTANSLGANANTESQNNHLERPPPTTAPMTPSWTQPLPWLRPRTAPAPRSDLCRRRCGREGHLQTPAPQSRRGKRHPPCGTVPKSSRIRQSRVSPQEKQSTTWSPSKILKLTYENPALCLNSFHSLLPVDTQDIKCRRFL